MKTIASYVLGEWYEADSGFVTLTDPTTEEEIARKIRRLRIHRVLQGVRGAQPVDLDALVATIHSFARFCGTVEGAIHEIDINPLHVGARGILALDALIVGSERPPVAA